jgi:hypothetical protein
MQDEDHGDAPDITDEVIAATEKRIRGSNANKAEVEIAKMRMLRDAGYTVVDARGKETVASEDLRVLMESHILKARAEDRAERLSSSISRNRMMTLLMPDLPEYDSEDWYELDVLTRTAWMKIAQLVWRLIDARAMGRLQRMIAKSEDGLVLVKTQVGEDGVPSVYVTTSPKLVAADVFKPMEDQVSLAAENMATEVVMFGRRNPALAAPGRKALKRSVKSAQVSIDRILLKAGSDEDDEGEE